MNFTKTIFALAIGSVGIMGAVSASAAAVASGTTLSIATGATSSGAATAGTTSWFAMDNDGNAKIALSEKIAIVQGSTGIVIGQTSASSPNGGGANPKIQGLIDTTWGFFGAYGSDYVTTGITQTSATSMNLSGWTVAWNGLAAIPMGTGAWTPLNAAANGMATAGYANGSAVLNWDGNYGSTYKLDYTATVPLGDPSNFGGVKYALHLEGVVTAAPVPEASTYGMMMAGLGLVGFMASRRRKSI